MRNPIATWQEHREAHRRALGIVGALAGIRDAARERPPGDRLVAATAAALAAGVQPGQVMRAAMTGASLSSPDPGDFEHRTAAYGIARQVVDADRARRTIAPAKEEP